ncbi:MAG: DUF4290 domain-containing protein [Prevotella sp.]
MNIEGLDYNTQRERLVLPEYGREVQNMVDYALTLTDTEDRQQCAETIIATMARMSTQNRESEDFYQKLWDHLALMSNFKLDIDYPYDVTQVDKIYAKGDPVVYPMNNIPVRHYGHMLFEVFEKLKTMEPGVERDELVRATANQMKRNLVQWGHGSSDDEKVAFDLERFTDGNIVLDLDRFKFDRIEVKELDKKRKKR